MRVRATASAPVEPRTYTGTHRASTRAPPPAPYTARWRANPANPPLNPLPADPWNNPSTDTRANMCWKQSTTPSDCDTVVGNLASRSPWDFSPHANASTNTTAGNNARSAESWQDGGQPGPNQFHPVSTTRDYTFPWTNEWFTKDCDPGTPYGANFQVGKSFDVSAAAVNLFTVHNRMHDFAYLLGFTEDNFNSQESNFGLTEPFRENDPVVGDVQAGAATAPPGVYASSRNNANMSTLPDGSSSITNMYLWQPVAGAFYPPCVDGDFDAGVIGHEYTHMIENRTIGKGDGRTGFQAGAMGEASGDLFSIEELNEFGLVPTGDENRYATGTYVTGNKLRGIRNYAANFPYTGAFPEPSVYPQVDPLNFSDVGYDVTGPEVHADGEIWVAINFELRKALAAKYNEQFPESDAALQKQCALGQVPVTQCPGNRRWIQLAFDSFLLMQTAPSMVDARNAILAADQARFGGANQAEIWAAFARRGLGRFASQTNGSGRTARRGVRHQPAAGLRGAGPGQRQRDLRGHEHRDRQPGGQGAHLRRPLRGARLADRRHRPGDQRPEHGEREQPRREGDVRARDLRVHRHRPGLRRGALPQDVQGQRQPDDRAALRAQLRVDDAGRAGDGRRRAGDQRRRAPWCRPGRRCSRT